MNNYKNKILVTGGAGYIGTHTCIALHEAGYEIVIYDNLSNSSKEAINRVSSLIGKPIEFIEGDIRDADSLRKAFTAHQFLGSFISLVLKQLANQSLSRYCIIVIM